MDAKKISEAALKLLSKHKFVLIVVAVGILMLSWPPGGDGSEKKSVNTEEPENFSIRAEEDRIASLLERTKGVGRVAVMLSAAESERSEYAVNRREDLRASGGEGDSKSRDQSVESDHVIISSPGGETPVIVGRTYPKYIGALIVCDGADSPETRLDVVRAVSSLTGLGANRITVVKMRTEN